MQRSSHRRSSLARALTTFRISVLWLVGIIRRRTGNVFGTAVGVALAVAMLASLGTFLASSKASMTSRAIATVAVDWQVEIQPGADAAAAQSAVAADPHVVNTSTVSVATTTGFEHTGSGGTQTTGPGQVLGLPTDYRQIFPGGFRTLAGSDHPTGAVLFQQTAANLGAQPGDVIIVGRAGLPPVRVPVAGVVDIPQADSLFQKVGAPVGAQPQAPPDNVLLLPAGTWHTDFDPLAKTRPDQVHTQIHARVSHDSLPPDPIAAYDDVSGQARNLEVHLAGAGLVGDNLGAALDAARSDALYAQVLFLFLGAPGAVLAAILTCNVAAASRTRRRRDQALLRARGASSGQLSAVGLAEALLIGVLGSIAGLGLAMLAGKWALGTATPGTTLTALTWWGAAAIGGLAITTIAIAVPAHLDSRRLTVAASRQVVGRQRRNPWWMRWWIDIALLAVAALILRSTTKSTYQLVLAVEGIPTVSVSYWAFAGPALLWIGGSLLIYRLVYLLVAHGRGVVRAALRPLCGSLSDMVAATLQRQRRAVALAATVAALTVGFAASTAVFDTTYRQQAEVDAVLTNGADVTVTTSPGTVAAPDSAMATALAKVSGVQHVEPMQHRFAYVGSDLQDMYGVNPGTVVNAGRLQNAYFQGGTASSLINRLATRPDSVLVSAETVHDFQLVPGDLLRLRLQNGVTKKFVEVPFHYAGVVKEFPTAPSDSILVANAAYIAKATGSAAVGAFLVDTGGHNVATVASRVRHLVGTKAAVTDIASSRRIVGTSLTAVDLNGLTRLELAFALALAVAATGLSLWLGLNERRRTYAIAAALGARTRDLAGFVIAEAGTVAITGLALGTALALALSRTLVSVLQGVFDPPPEHPVAPSGYLLAVLVLAIASAAVAAALVVRSVREPRMDLLRSDR
jgi:putative ABC transport system permease protein